MAEATPAPGIEAPHREIVGTIEAMHSAIVDSATRKEMRFSSLAWIQTTVEWTTALQPGCELTVTATYPGYRDLGLPLIEEIDRYKGHRNFPLSLCMPGGKTGSYNLIVSPNTKEVKVTQNENFENLGTLPVQGLLHLLGVATPNEVLEYIHATAAEDQERVRTYREAIHGAPKRNEWPYLHATDVAIGSKVLEKRAHIRKLRSKNRPFTEGFEGSLKIDDDGAQHMEYTYYDDRNPNISTVTSERLYVLKGLADATLDIVYGHACFCYDNMRNSIREENSERVVVGLDGQPNKYASKGYRYGFATRPIQPRT
jgi:hypothetical protein